MLQIGEKIFLPRRIKMSSFCPARFGLIAAIVTCFREAHKRCLAVLNAAGAA